MIKIKVHIPRSLTESLDKIQQQKTEILKVGGQAIRRVLANHVRMLAETRHSSSTKLGIPPSGHWKASDVGQPVVEDDTVYVPMFTPGITRALHDVLIKPIRSKNLAIPFNRLTAGLGPRELGMRGGQKLFFYLTKKGSKSLAANMGGSLIVMYILKSQVNQRRDPSLLPDDDVIDDAFANAVSKSISYIIHNQ